MTTPKPRRSKKPRKAKWENTSPTAQRGPPERGWRTPTREPLYGLLWPSWVGTLFFANTTF